MTWETFFGQMSRMAGLKFVPSDMTTHWEALRDVPDAVLEAAVSRAQKTRVEFPTPAELREDANQVAHLVRDVAPDEDRGVDLAEPFTITVPHVGTVVSVSREWKYYCDICSDLGWRSAWCGSRMVGTGEAEREIAKPWQPSRSCARTMGHGPHEFVERCACWEINPALVRKRELQRTYAERASDKKRGRAAA